MTHKRAIQMRIYRILLVLKTNYQGQLDKSLKVDLVAYSQGNRYADAIKNQNEILKNSDLSSE